VAKGVCIAVLARRWSSYSG